MSDAEPILAVKNVSKAFGAVQALNRVSLEVYPGQVVALAGDNGAGKSTIIKAISGVFRHDEGEILLDSKAIDFATPHEARESGIETIYQDLALADNLSIGENIFLGREPKRKLFGFLPILDRARMAKAAKEAMASLDFHVNSARRASRRLFRRAAPGDRHRAGALLERTARHHGRADCCARRPRAAPRVGAD